MASPSAPATRREVLSLYREILRTARVFRTSSSPEQADMVMQSARREIEQHRGLTVREDILRHIVVARAALDEVQTKISEKVRGGAADKQG